MDLFGIFDKLNKLKAVVQSTNDSLNHMMVTGKFNSTVEIVCNGHKEIQKVSIDKEYYANLSKSQLENDVLMAVNEALNQAGELKKNELKDKTQGLIPNIPGIDLSQFGLG